MNQENAEELKKKRMLDNLLSDDMKEIVPYLEEPTVTDIAVVDSGEIIVTTLSVETIFPNPILISLPIAFPICPNLDLCLFDILNLFPHLLDICL